MILIRVFDPCPCCGCDPCDCDWGYSVISAITEALISAR